jgi:hypothetical protein
LDISWASSMYILVLMFHPPPPCSMWLLMWAFPTKILFSFFALPLGLGQHVQSVISFGLSLPNQY